MNENILTSDFSSFYNSFIILFTYCSQKLSKDLKQQVRMHKMHRIICLVRLFNVKFYTNSITKVLLFIFSKNTRYPFLNSLKICISVVDINRNIRNIYAPTLYLNQVSYQLSYKIAKICPQPQPPSRTRSGQ